MRMLSPILLILAGAAPPPAPPPAAAISFFAGQTEGRGTLSKVASSRRAFAVRSRGTVEGDGSLVVEQVVEVAGKLPQRRAWRIRETAPGQLTGTLTSAVGPITGEATGDTLHLRYRMKGGLDARQTLVVAPDGRSAHNVMKIRKFGIVVASLDETIRKLD